MPRPKRKAMPRPRGCRRIGWRAGYRRFGPAGQAAGEPIVLGLDELEAIRLADFEGLYQEQAAERMNVSRQTFGRIVAEARKKVARSLVEGLPLVIEGGEVEMVDLRTFVCKPCGREWSVPYGGGRPPGCPECGSPDFGRFGGGGRGRGGRGRGRFNR